MYINKEKLNKILDERNISLRELLLRADISQNAFFSLQRKRNILPKSIQRLIDILHIDEAVLLSFPNEETLGIRLPFQVPAHIKESLQELIAFCKTQKSTIVLFGSRAYGRKSMRSDWDFALCSKKVIRIRDFLLIKNKIKSLSWPYKVDLVYFNNANPQLKESILKKYTVIYGEDILYGEHNE